METRKIPISYSDYVKGIPFLDIDEQLTLLEVISARVKKSIRKRRNKNTIMELEGLGADIWKGIDAQEFVHRERSSCFEIFHDVSKRSSRLFNQNS